MSFSRHKKILSVRWNEAEAEQAAPPAWRPSFRSVFSRLFLPGLLSSSAHVRFAAATSFSHYPAAVNCSAAKSNLSPFSLSQSRGPLEHAYCSNSEFHSAHISGAAGDYSVRPFNARMMRHRARHVSPYTVHGCALPAHSELLIDRRDAQQRRITCWLFAHGLRIAVSDLHICGLRCFNQFRIRKLAWLAQYPPAAFLNREH